MKRLKSWKIAICCGSDGFLKNGEVVSVREEVAVVEHIDPNLPICDYFCSKSFFNHLAGCCWSDGNPTVFQIVFHAFLGQLECVFHSLSGTFLFQWREVLLGIVKAMSTLQDYLE